MHKSCLGYSRQVVEPVKVCLLRILLEPRVTVQLGPSLRWHGGMVTVGHSNLTVKDTMIVLNAILMLSVMQPAMMRE